MTRRRGVKKKEQETKQRRQQTEMVTRAFEFLYPLKWNSCQKGLGLNIKINF